MCSTDSITQLCSYLWSVPSSQPAFVFHIMYKSVLLCLVSPNIPLTTTRLHGWSQVLQPHLCCSVCVIMWSHKCLNGGYITNFPVLCCPDTVVVTTRQQCSSAGGADRPESVTFPSSVKDPQRSYPKIRQNSCGRHVPPRFIFLITQDQLNFQNWMKCSRLLLFWFLLNKSHKV